MPITYRQGPTVEERNVVETGVVEIDLAGLTYRGSYMVQAEGSTRKRLTVTPDKRIVVSYRGRHRGTAIGHSGLELMASTLLHELVLDSPSSVLPANNQR
jgi:hypothetical protein